MPGKAEASPPTATLVEADAVLVRPLWVDEIPPRPDDVVVVAFCVTPVPRPPHATELNRQSSTTIVEIERAHRMRDDARKCGRPRRRGPRRTVELNSSRDRAERTADLHSVFAAFLPTSRKHGLRLQGRAARVTRLPVAARFGSPRWRAVTRDWSCSIGVNRALGCLRGCVVTTRRRTRPSVLTCVLPGCVRRWSMPTTVRQCDESWAREHRGYA